MRTNFSWRSSANHSFSSQRSLYALLLFEHVLSTSLILSKGFEIYRSTSRPIGSRGSYLAEEEMKSALSPVLSMSICASW